jgi:hypothetical protein
MILPAETAGLPLSDTTRTSKGISAGMSATINLWFQAPDCTVQSSGVHELHIV